MVRLGQSRFGSATTARPDEGAPAEGSDADGPQEPDAAALLRAAAMDLRGRDDRRAADLFAAARRRGDTTTSTLHEQADALYRLESLPEALALFEAASARSDAGYWTHVNGARAAIAAGREDAAVVFVRRGAARHPDDPVWADLQARAGEEDAACAREQARRLLAAGLRAAADATEAAAVRRAVAAADASGRPTAPSGLDGSGRVVFLANHDLAQCVHYRVEQKLEMLRHLGRPVEVFDMRTGLDAFVRAAPGASAALVYRVPAQPRIVRALVAARHAGTPLLYDVDDLIFDPAFPEPLETYRGAIDAGRHENLRLSVPLEREAIRLCDAALAPTPALETALRPLVRTGVVFPLPNGLDSRNTPFLRSSPRPPREDGGVVVFYGSGTPAHGADFETLAVPALLSALARHPRMRLSVAGHVMLDARFTAYADRIVRAPWSSDLDAYWALLAGADVNLAVLSSNRVTDAKSAIKWLEAAVFAIPSVVGATALYRDLVRDGEDALVAATPDAWTRALDRLVSDADLRRRLGAAARARAAAEFGLEANAARLEAALAFAESRPRRR